MAVADMVWYARHGNVKIGDTIASVVLTSPLYTQVADNLTTLTPYVENVEITGGRMNIEAINTLGITQKVFERRPEIRECSFETVFSDASKLALTRMAGTKLTTSGDASTYTRYQLGEKATVAAHRIACAVGIQFTNGTDIVNCLLNNAYMSNYDGPSLAGDDYGKASVTFQCLAGDYYDEDNMADV